jgi:hypothetical protein
MPHEPGEQGVEVLRVQHHAVMAGAEGPRQLRRAPESGIVGRRPDADRVNLPFAGDRPHRTPQQGALRRPAERHADATGAGHLTLQGGQEQRLGSLRTDLDMLAQARKLAVGPARESAPPNFQIRSRGNRQDSAEAGLPGWRPATELNPLEDVEVGHRVNAVEGEERLVLAGEDDALPIDRVVQRRMTDPVAREQQPPLGAVPTGDREGPGEQRQRLGPDRVDQLEDQRAVVREPRGVACPAAQNSRNFFPVVDGTLEGDRAVLQHVHDAAGPSKPEMDTAPRRPFRRLPASVDQPVTQGA